ncbi:flagellar hook-associated protein FlgL [Caldicellulosiruptor morganii]|uniref:Flagellin n=1 Tax=Caldicellulosiruptor morganii TaxID=1387555 RepID=A0ABY7BNE8_9FIRM|nr:flagellar hook-associated protein FlgL [Caldicellulosiruptor morganii]WAM33051.1 flagellar hook-associated protein FlgL [Caldicellulosiruptor morganii]
MRINNNIQALNTYNRLTINNDALAKSLEKLSSGMRINRAGDDAAGLAISEKMRSQIRGLNQAQRNAQDAISLIQTAEGALNEVHSILQRMRELAVQAANDTNTDADRNAIQNEVDQLVSEIDRIANTTEFNTKKLLDGTVIGIKPAVNGTYGINNNSSLTSDDIQVVSEAAIQNGSKVNGAITIVRIGTGTTYGNFEIRDSFGNKIANGTGSTVGVNLSVSGITLIVEFEDTVLATSAVTLKLQNIDNMKVGESITLTLTAYQDAQTDTSKAITTQIGANTGQTMQIGIDSMKGIDLGVIDNNGNTIKVNTKYAASAAIAVLDNAISKVSEQRSRLGAYQNRLEHTINNLGTASENLTASESRIRDVDMAKEMMNYTKNNILMQAATAMLAQANQLPQAVLQLLR